MKNSYIGSKALDTARVLSKDHGIDFNTALFVAEAVWDEARRALLKVAGTPEYQRLSFSEKSEVCASVIKGLLDKKRIAGFLSGEIKSIV